MTQERRSGGRTGRRMMMLGAALGPMVLAVFGATPVEAADPVTIKIENFSFVPDTLTVPVGATVTWENGDDIPHSVVLTDKSFRSKPLDTHDKASFTFTKAGEIEYFCGLHPHMHGKITVLP